MVKDVRAEVEVDEEDASGAAGGWGQGEGEGYGVVGGSTLDREEGLRGLDGRIEKLTGLLVGGLGR